MKKIKTYIADLRYKKRFLISLFILFMGLSQPVETMAVPPVSNVISQINGNMKGIENGDGRLIDAGSFRGRSSFGRSHSGSRSHHRSRHSGSSSSGDSDIRAGAIVYFILFLLLFTILIGVIKRAFGRRKQDFKVKESVEESIKKIDPQFRAEDIQNHVARLYVMLQKAWADNNLSSMQPYLSAQLYGQLSNQLEEMRRRGLRNYITETVVLRTEIKMYTQDEVNDILQIHLSTRLLDYTVDRTGTVIVGSTSKYVFMEYNWELIRTRKDRISTSEAGSRIIRCSGCGAPLDINQSTVCEYCGSVITAKHYDWIVNRIEGLAQRNG